MLTITGPIKKKTISTIYLILQGELTNNSLDIKEKWEPEIKTMILGKKLGTILYRRTYDNKQPCMKGIRLESQDEVF